MISQKRRNQGIRVLCNPFIFAWSCIQVFLINMMYLDVWVHPCHACKHLRLSLLPWGNFKLFSKYLLLNLFIYVHFIIVRLQASFFIQSVYDSVDRIANSQSSCLFSRFASPHYVRKLWLPNILIFNGSVYI